MEGKIVVFKYVGNKWKYIDGYNCCSSNCGNTNNPISFCKEGTGFPKIKSNTKIEYINCSEKNGHIRFLIIVAENYFLKPIGESIQTFTLYYSEAELKFDKNEFIYIGLGNENDNIYLFPKYKSINYAFQDNLTSIKLPSFNYKTNDIIGCGLVYPPPKLNNKLPYIFFTQNGKQIGKAILIGQNCEDFKPYVVLGYCSVEANFGNNSFYL
ncbi:hypothetical protein Mgra_00009583 [Meloidogyne graminicola]|uniref:SPRY domain-containing protein n=1 Tax=Meloidogyne graminicola TaxID=189291 RepID=A0A8S9ZB54_9BILA|nr:hypothetical protein Mgra_00009583 [Meloidogyne graminicola]